MYLKKCLLLLPFLMASFVHAQTPRDISALRSVRLHVGDKVLVKFDQHASVGLYADYKVANERIVKYVETKSEFVNPQVPNMVGNDAAKGQYIFQALARGTTQIKVRRMFRMKVENEKNITIIVR
jgi:hypothetical protein